ncbi:diacylglycerol kinase [Patescibacteria group bacterium]|nr:diacylglycerol kinase [Patescibacteria group bacterium]MBU1907514.1 diacylglycerol kinase [Patescibacteria group bacterium]
MLLNSLKHSFEHAWRGLCLAFRTERSFRIQTVAGVVVFAVMLIAPLSEFERAVLLLAIAAVIVLELLNSAVERMVDLFKPRLSQYVGDIKDLMSAAVLAASIFAAIIGFFILWPHLSGMLVRF